MEVNRAGHIKAAAVSIAVIFLISIVCVLGYHYLVSKSIEGIVLRNKIDLEQNMAELARINGEMVLVISDLDEMAMGLSLQYQHIESLMRNQDIFLLINKEQTKMIRGLDRRELARHLEVIRALAILQKKHWKNTKPMKPILLIPENAPKIEESDKTIQKW